MLTSRKRIFLVKLQPLILPAVAGHDGKRIFE